MPDIFKFFLSSKFTFGLNKRIKSESARLLSISLLIEKSIVLSEKKTFKLTSSAWKMFFTIGSLASSFEETIKFDVKNFNGVIGSLELNLSENTAKVSEELKLFYEGQIYSADSILVDLSEKKILKSTNVRYETLND